MSNKHTPGPWLVSYNTFDSGEDHGIYKDGDFDIKGLQIAVVSGLPTSSNTTTEDEGKANAKLIAAAPELLQAAKDLLQIVKLYNQEGTETLHGRIIASAERTIRKATE